MSEEQQNHPTLVDLARFHLESAANPQSHVLQMQPNGGTITAENAKLADRDATIGLGYALLALAEQVGRKRQPIVMNLSGVNGEEAWHVAEKVARAMTFKGGATPS